MTQTILSSFISGVIFARPDFTHLNAEDEVKLVFEPHNKFDARAIRVHHPVAGMLGYVPKETTVCLHDAVANVLPFKAKIVSSHDNEKWPKIHLVVTVEI